jgi:hypothetical protein
MVTHHVVVVQKERALKVTWNQRFRLSFGYRLVVRCQGRYHGARRGAARRMVERAEDPAIGGNVRGRRGALAGQGVPLNRYFGRRGACQRISAKRSVAGQVGRHIGAEHLRRS